MIESSSAFQRRAGLAEYLDFSYVVIPSAARDLQVARSEETADSSPVFACGCVRLGMTIAKRSDRRASQYCASLNRQRSCHLPQGT